MTDKGSLVYPLASARDRGPEPKVKATKQELVAALREISYTQRAVEARKIAKRVLGK